MLHATNFDAKGHDLDIHVRTTVEYDYSFIESAAVKINNDILEVSSYGLFSVNGVETPYLGGKAGYLAQRYPIHHTRADKKTDLFDIVLSPAQNITLKTHKDWVSVSLTGGVENAKYFGESVGLMGSFNGELLARDGQTRLNHDMNVFAQEWQVTDAEPKLFMTDRAPQYPAKCILPTPETSSQRRLGGQEWYDNAKEACSGLVGYKHNDCVQDVMAVRDVDAAKHYFQ